MDRRERAGQGTTSMLAAFEGLQSTIWTALPGTITGWDPVKQTARVQPLIKVRVQKPDGSFIWVTMPELLDCPVHFPHGGGVTLTFPLAVGDECLMIFGSRCIDNWWKMGAGPANDPAQEQAEFRMHDLSDGFCLAGFNSVPKVIPDINTTAAQLRTDDGNTFVEVNPATNSVTLQATGTINLLGTINIVGNISITGNIMQTGSIVSSGDIMGVGTSLHTHVHGGVSSGSADTSPPL